PYIAPTPSAHAVELFKLASAHAAELRAADEAAALDELAAGQPAAIEHTAASLLAAVEHTTADLPAADEPAALDEPATTDEPTAVAEPTITDEPTAAAEPAALVEDLERRLHAAEAAREAAERDAAESAAYIGQLETLVENLYRQHLVAAHERAALVDEPAGAASEEPADLDEPAVDEEPAAASELGAAYDCAAADLAAAYDRAAADLAAAYDRAADQLAAAHQSAASEISAVPGQVMAEFPDEFESTADEHAAPANESVGAGTSWLDAADEPAVVPEHAIAVAYAAWSGPDDDNDDDNDDDDDGETNSSSQKRGSASTLVASDDHTSLRRYDDVRKPAPDKGKGRTMDEDLLEHISFEDAVAAARLQKPEVLLERRRSCDEELSQIEAKISEQLERLDDKWDLSNRQEYLRHCALFDKLDELHLRSTVISHEQLVYDSALGTFGPEACL
ncbi:hypothetical protein IWQ56_004411, partial [Coemansia nantahalensis]